VTNAAPEFRAPQGRRFFYSTRDLLMMAALAALGGVTSTYVNALGDAVQSALGFVGTTQWAAGLHVLWLTLAVGLVRKPGAGTATGILKGAVELLSGNTHGLLVLLVDAAAGLLVDLGFALFRRKESAAAFALAGGLGSASNVAVFQLFAALPADILAYGAIALVGGMAFLSGVIFAGFLARALLAALRRAGAVKDQPPAPVGRRTALLALAAAAALTGGLALYLRMALQGPGAVSIVGAVASPYAYPTAHGDIAEVTAEGTLRGATARYTGVWVRELVERAQPAEDARLLLVRAADGYAFFISMGEVYGSRSLLLTRQGRGKEAAYGIVGAENSKAWVRNVTELVVIGAPTLPISGALEAPGEFDPNVWQFEMDSAPIDVGQGPEKLQGAKLGAVLATMQPQAGATTLALQGAGGETTLPLQEALTDESIRIFTVVGEAEVEFAVATMDGTVLATQVTAIEVR
jgi:energy-coupling factor transport system substrate-specific component